jgi:hypothetical protein
MFNLLYSEGNIKISNKEKPRMPQVTIACPTEDKEGIPDNAKILETTKDWAESFGIAAEDYQLFVRLH